MTLQKVYRFFDIINYRLGLTHQFGCWECGAPLSEAWTERWGGGWNWKCDFCGYEGQCVHRPNILKPAHRRVLFLRKMLWGLRHASSADGAFCDYAERLYTRARAERRDGAAELIMGAALSKSCAWASDLDDLKRGNEDSAPS